MTQAQAQTETRTTADQTAATNVPPVAERTRLQILLDNEDVKNLPHYDRLLAIAAGDEEPVGSVHFEKCEHGNHYHIVDDGGGQYGEAIGTHCDGTQLVNEMVAMGVVDKAALPDALAKLTALDLPPGSPEETAALREEELRKLQAARRRQPRSFEELLELLAAGG